jgi:hypothetical protein
VYSGKEIKIEGETYTLPPISLGQLRGGLTEKFKLHDELVTDGKYWEYMALRGEIIFSALRRNYPDFSEEKFMNFIDLSNVTPLWLCILGASGLMPGETLAVTSVGPLVEKLETGGTLNPSTNL